jgi:hypothetical protein
MADVHLDSVRLEAWIGGAWVDLMPDVVLGDRVACNYGIFGFGPTDRVAGAGAMTFTLDNSAQNSYTTLGKYTPGHASALIGWDINIRVRLVVSYSTDNLAIYDEGLYDEIAYGIERYKYSGRVRSIKPAPDTVGERRVRVGCTDWMDDASRYKTSLLAPLTNTQSDAVIRAVLAGMTVQPEGTSLGVGQENFTYSLDMDKDEKTTGLSAIQKAVISEFGYAYVRGDDSTGGLFVFENRHLRVRNLTADYTFAEGNLIDLASDRSLDNVYNIIRATSYPRDVGVAHEVLFSLTTNDMTLAPGETRVITGRYTDPSNIGTRVSGINMEPCTVSTDYNFSSSTGDTGDLNGSFSIVAEYGANSVGYTVRNTGSVGGFITKLQARGHAVRIYDAIVSLAENAASQLAYGDAPLDLLLPFQDNPYAAYDFAVATLAVYKDPVTFYSKVTSMTHDSDALLKVLIALEPGHRVDLTETMTAMDGHFWVNGISFELDEYLLPIVGMTVSPASLQNYWLLGIAGASEVGVTTWLGF